MSFQFPALKRTPLWKPFKSWELESQQTHLDLFRKRSAEHQGLSDAFVRHGVLLHDASYLWFKAHVQHAVCLI